MAREPQKTGTSPLVLLSLCLSLLAVALSASTLMIIPHTWRKPPSELGVRAVKWDWDQKIDRVEKYLERVRSSLSQGSEKDRESSDERMHSVRGELEAWIKAAEPRLHDTIARMAAQAEEVRVALRERSEQTSEKLEALRESLKSFRQRIGQKTTEAPAKEGSPKVESKP